MRLRRREASARSTPSRQAVCAAGRQAEGPVAGHAAGGGAGVQVGGQHLIQPGRDTFAGWTPSPSGPPPGSGWPPPRPRPPWRHGAHGVPAPAPAGRRGRAGLASASRPPTTQGTPPHRPAAGSPPKRRPPPAGHRPGQPASSAPAPAAAVRSSAAGRHLHPAQPPERLRRGQRLHPAGGQPATGQRRQNPQRPERRHRRPRPLQLRATPGKKPPPRSPASQRSASWPAPARHAHAGTTTPVQPGLGQHPGAALAGRQAQHPSSNCGMRCATDSAITENTRNAPQTAPPAPAP